MFNIWFVEFDMCLSKARHYILTVIILYKQNVLCARMVGAPVEEKGLSPGAPPHLAPERDVTALNEIHPPTSKTRKAGIK